VLSGTDTDTPLIRRVDAIEIMTNMQSKSKLPVKTIAFTSFLLAASSNLYFNPLITNQTKQKHENFT